MAIIKSLSICSSIDLSAASYYCRSTSSPLPIDFFHSKIFRRKKPQMADRPSRRRQPPQRKSQWW